MLKLPSGKTRNSAVTRAEFGAGIYLMRVSRRAEQRHVLGLWVA